MCIVYWVAVSFPALNPGQREEKAGDIETNFLVVQFHIPMQWNATFSVELVSDCLVLNQDNYNRCLMNR